MKERDYTTTPPCFLWRYLSISNESKGDMIIGDNESKD